MANCRRCTAPITWARTENGESIPLDDHDQRDWGSNRYRIVLDGHPPTVALIPEESPARTFVDHRHLCRATMEAA